MPPHAKAGSTSSYDAKGGHLKPRSYSLDWDSACAVKTPAPSYQPQAHRRLSLNPASAARGGRMKQAREAQEMAAAVEERARRTGETPPPYTFLELIGKGSFGRVYTSRKRENGREGPVIALKIVDVDDSDYKLNAEAKDHTITDFLNEIQILQTLKDSRAQNINIIHDAFSFHSQLWIVSDYCPGGSVHTLMKACNPPGLEERFIIVISRELATALKYVHENHIIHRDVKAANVLIRQDGQLQLCDFGVSGILDSKMGKRATIIGTPYWMPPEMHDETPPPEGYGTEIDIWSYGITVYELAEGRPPNSTIAPGRLGMFLNRAPMLEKEKHGANLVDFVAYCLAMNPTDRPSADNILANPFLTNSSKKYPTNMLRELIDRYAQWEQLGGERVSLFHGSGAQGPSALSPIGGDDDYWNFDTMHESYDSGYERTTRGPAVASRISKPGLAYFEKLQQEQRAARGGMKMGRLFDPEGQPYQYQSYDDDDSESDLPLRNLGGSANVRESIIDLDDAMDFAGGADVDLANIPTVRANKKTSYVLPEDEDDFDFAQQNLTKRMTRDWKFPMMTMPASEMPRPRTQDWSMAQATAELQSQSADEAEKPTVRLAAPLRPTLKHMTTEPIGTIGDFVHPNSEDNTRSIDNGDRTSMIDLDAGFASDEETRPSTAESSDVTSSFTDSSNADPFDLDSEQSQLTMRHRASFHTHSQSEPNPDRTSQYASENAIDDAMFAHIRGSLRGSSMDESYTLDNALALGRAPSVKDSMASLHDLADDEDGSPTDLKIGVYGNGQSRFPFNRASSTWSQHAAQQDRPQNHHHPAFAHRARMAPEDPFRPISSTARDLRSQRRGRSRGRAGPGTPPMNSTRAPPVLKPFPTISTAHPDALEDDAETDLVVSEVQRLLTDYMGALKFTGDLLQKPGRREHHLERSFTYS
ncbi:MAG: hypothetical protein M1828_005378 [Chrysothrix sp. TS-e1954]|nr:MAG: hypothetical protein M1828_005378 [Chrysothrix sp. TS-e1954]